MNHSHTGAKPRESLKKNRRIFAFYRAAVNHSLGDGLLQNLDFLQGLFFAKGGEGTAFTCCCCHSTKPGESRRAHFLEKLFHAFHKIQFSAISNLCVFW